MPRHRFTSEEARAAAAKVRRPRGFAVMSAEDQRRIASMGGRAAHKSGNAYVLDSERARVVGGLGGRRDREHMLEISARSSEARAAKRELKLEIARDEENER